MKCLILFICVLLTGCVATQQESIPADQPELISMAPFPRILSTAPMEGFKLNVLLHVAEDGTVADVRMLGSGGTLEWDSLAVQSMKKWRFTVPRRDGIPVSLWIRKVVIVQIQERIMRNIGELVFATRKDADSLYSLIRTSADFDSLSRHVWGTVSGEFGQYLGPVDLAVFPQHVRVVLEKLREDEVTRPIRVGDTFVIYKRFRKDYVPPSGRSGAGCSA